VAREELDRNRRKPEVDIEILQRAEAWFLAIRSWGGPRAARDAEVRRHAEAIVRLLEGGMMTTAATASSTRLSPAVDNRLSTPIGDYRLGAAAKYPPHQVGRLLLTARAVRGLTP
jgi:hypothetical protein